MTLTFSNSSPVSRLVVATLAAWALGAALPQTASAASDAGIWRVDASKSRVNERSATLTLHRVDGTNSAPGSFIVISGMGVYRMTGSHATDSAGLKPVDFANMTRTGEAVLIGTHPRSPDACAYKCRAGLPETTRTVTFKIVNSGQRQIRDMLAYDADE